MNGTYRFDRRNLWTAWGCIVCSLLMIGAFVVGASTPPHDRRLLFILICGPVPVLMLCGGIYLLLAIKRCRLVVDEKHLESQGVWTTRRIALDEICSARWRISDRLVMKTLESQVSVNFNDFSSDDQRTLVKFFRCRLPREIQHDWESYWSREWRLFDLSDPSAMAPEIRAEHIRSTRRSSDWLFLYGCFLTITTTLAIWLVSGNTESLRPMMLLVPLAAWWLWNRKHVRLPGKIRARFPCEQKTNVLVVVGLTLFAIALPLLLAFMALDMESYSTALMVVLGAAFVVFYLGIIVESIRSGKQRKNQDAEIASLVEKEHIAIPTPKSRIPN